MTAVTRVRGGAVALLAALGLLLALLAPTAHAAHRTNTVELPATGNVAAALAWSAATFAENTAADVVIGRDDRFPDNLTSGLLQGALGAPLLLTPSDHLHDDVADELERLGAESVHVLGGEGAINASVSAELRAKGYTVQRSSGTSRVETAVAVARAYAPAATTVIISRAFGTPGGDETQAWADALAAGAWSADDGHPVLLTESDRLSASVTEYLSGSPVREAAVVGGSAAIGDAVLAELAALGIRAERIFGATRFETAIAVARVRGHADAASAQRVILAEGQAADAWAAGFAGAAHASRHNAPVVLANGDTLPTPTRSFLQPGGAGTALRCAPSVRGGACDAAADQLGQSVVGKVTLASTDVELGTAVKGTIAPLDDVKAITVAGDCVASGAVTPDAQGAFSRALTTSQPGPCGLVFTIEHADGRKVTQTITVTLVLPPKSTDAPELSGVTLIGSKDGATTVRFAFDQTIRDAVGVDRFLLIGPDTGVRFPASSVVRDPNRRYVDAVFATAHYELATTAAVDSGAVSNINQTPNPPANAALKPRALGNGLTEAPDLVSVTWPSALTGDGDLVLTYVFDEAVTTLSTTASNFPVVRADGTTVDPVSVAVGADARRATVTFSGVHGTLAAYKSDFRRAVVRAGAACRVIAGSGDDAVQRCTPLRAVALGSSGATTRPDLVGVSFDVENARATFTFDEDIATTPTPAPARFLLFHSTGVSSPGREVIAATSRTVTVRFFARAVEHAVAGASVETDAVNGLGGRSAMGSVFLAPNTSAGSHFGPLFTGATVTRLPGPIPVDRVVFTFDRPVEVPSNASALYRLWTASGARLSPTTSCSNETAERIRCDYARSNDDRIGLATVAGGAAVATQLGAGASKFSVVHSSVVALPTP